MDKKIELTPQTANTLNKVCKLKLDNVSSSKSWMLLDGGTHVIITNQIPGEKATGQVRLTKKEFERFIKFYQTGK